MGASLFAASLLLLDGFTAVALAFRAATWEHVPLREVVHLLIVGSAVHFVWFVGICPDLVGFAAGLLTTAWVWSVQIRGPRPGPALVDMRGKQVIVTGSSSGIGEETALQLAARGAHVVLACRSEDRAMRSLQRIVAQTANRNVRFAELDLCSFESVRAFAKAFVERGGEVDVLVCNAGIMRPARGETGDGIEISMQVNHYSNYLLTRLLLPLLRKSTLPGGGRVVNVNSSIMKAACYRDGGFNFKDANQSPDRPVRRLHAGSAGMADLRTAPPRARPPPRPTACWARFASERVSDHDADAGTPRRTQVRHVSRLRPEQAR